MIAAYVDASAVLRLLFGEAGEKIAISQNRSYYSSQIVEVETFRALDRLRILEQLLDEETAAKNSELRNLLSALEIVPLSQEIVTHARSSFPIPVRALDAVHVGTAQWLFSQIGEIEFWTHDKRQGLAALSRGFQVHGCTLT